MTALKIIAISNFSYLLNSLFSDEIIHSLPFLHNVKVCFSDDHTTDWEEITGTPVEVYAKTFIGLSKLKQVRSIRLDLQTSEWGLHDTAAINMQGISSFSHIKSLDFEGPLRHQSIIQSILLFDNLSTLSLRCNSRLFPPAADEKDPYGFSTIIR